MATGDSGGCVKVWQLGTNMAAAVPREHVMLDELASTAVE